MSHESSSLHVAIFGASSGIALPIARIYAGRQAHIYLVGRDREKLTEIEKDCLLRGAAKVHIITSDLGSATHARAACEFLQHRCQYLDVLIIAQGSLGTTEQLLQDSPSCEALFNLNVQGPIAIGNAFIPFFRQKKSGTIAIFSSVAGDRGRASNFIYGASKAAMTAYASGLRALLAPYGVHVLTIKPGMVATAMTAHLPKSPLLADPEQVAKQVVGAIDKRKAVLYTPSFWRWIMLVVIHLPESLFMRLRF